MVVGGCYWLASCCWVVVGGCSWLAVVVVCAIDRFVVFFLVVGCTWWQSWLLGVIGFGVW